MKTLGTGLTTTTMTIGRQSQGGTIGASCSMRTLDAAHTDPLLTVAEMNLDAAAKRATCQCQMTVPKPVVTRAHAMAALDELERRTEDCGDLIAPLRAYLSRN